MRTAGVLGALSVLWAGALKAQETSLTIYQDGRVLVRRTVAVQVPAGTSTLSFGLSARSVDPGTLTALDDGVEIRGVRVEAPTTQDEALRRAVGTDVDFMLSRGDTVRFIRGTLLSADPPIVRVQGRLLFTLPGTPAFQLAEPRLAAGFELTVAATRPRDALRLAFQANGLQWRAAYSLVLPTGRSSDGSMTGLAIIENPGAFSFQDAEVQLLAGDVRRAAPAPRPLLAGRALQMSEMAVAGPSQEAVGETHVYTLPEHVDFAPSETNAVALFPRADVQVQPEYVLRQGNYVFQAPQRQPDQDLHPDIAYLVRRRVDTPFGRTPLPAGTVRVLSPDSAGRLQLLGEVQIAHTPPGRELHLTTGTAFDLTAQRTQLTFEPHGQREAVSSYRVVVQNAKTEDVTVEVLEEFPGQWEVLSSSVPPERLSASSVRFPAPVPAGGEVMLEYRVRVKW
ncbi:MAG: hypothetical protein ABSG61_01895 [Gemmatimonadales bacterium]|jgi:hypothetical protein